MKHFNVNIYVSLWRILYMKTYLLFIFILVAAGCTINNRTEFSFDFFSTEINGQNITVFDKDKTLTLIYGNEVSGRLHIFSQGEWQTEQPDLGGISDIPQDFHNKIILPRSMDTSFAFGNLEQEIFRFFNGIHANPCIPPFNADGCSGGFGEDLLSIIKSKKPKYVCYMPEGQFSNYDACDRHCDGECRLVFL